MANNLCLEQESNQQMVVSDLSINLDQEVKELQTKIIVENIDVTGKISNESIYNQESLDDLMQRSPSIGSPSHAQSDYILNNEWAQIARIYLSNDRNGLGINFIGMKSRGLVITKIEPRSRAERDGRLKIGDYILEIHPMNFQEDGLEQVSTGVTYYESYYRIVAARPINIALNDYTYLSRLIPLVPIRYLNDKTKLDSYFIEHKCSPMFQFPYSFFEINQSSNKTSSNLLSTPHSHSLQHLNFEQTAKLQPMEKNIVTLKKDSNGLGLIIPFYEEEKLPGVLIKMIGKGSAADINGKINANDRIIEVNGHSLETYTNSEVASMLRNCEPVVVLSLERRSHGSECPQLQQEITEMNLATSEPSTSEPSTSEPSTSAPSTSLPSTSRPSTSDVIRYSPEDGNSLLVGNTNDSKEDGMKSSAIHNTYSIERPTFNENLIKTQWKKILGPGVEIVIAKIDILDKNRGLGIILKGTVDVQNGKEVMRHYYIRSICPEGPIGRNGTLQVDDELLEISGYKMFNMKLPVVALFQKNLPSYACVICARRAVKVFIEY